VTGSFVRRETPAGTGLRHDLIEVAGDRDELCPDASYVMGVASERRAAGVQAKLEKNNA